LASTPLAQRRQAQPDHVEPVKQVFPEQALAHPLLHVLVGGRDDPHVGPDRLVAADPVEVVVGQHPQQAGLEFGRHVADLVEEQGAALGLLETAPAHGLGAGESPALVAEEFGLEQVAGDRRGVDGDEGRIPPRAVPMQRPGHQLLAGAGLAVDEHRGVGLGQAADGAEDLLHRRRLPEDLRHRAELLDGAALVGALLDGAPHQLDSLVHVEGLGQVFEGSALEGRHRTVEIGVGGHDDDRDVRKARLDLGEQRQP
jgi:hypothetical protein